MEYIDRVDVSSCKARILEKLGMCEKLEFGNEIG